MGRVDFLRVDFLKLINKSIVSDKMGRVGLVTTTIYVPAAIKLNGFRKSTPPQNRQLSVYYY